MNPSSISIPAIPTTEIHAAREVAREAMTAFVEGRATPDQKETVRIYCDSQREQHLKDRQSGQAKAIPHIPSYWQRSEPELIGILGTSTIAEWFGVPTTPAEEWLVTSGTMPCQLSFAYAASLNARAKSDYMFMVAAPLETVGVTAYELTHIVALEVLQDSLPDGEALCIFDVLEWWDEYESVLPALTEVCLSVTADRLAVSFIHLCEKCDPYADEAVR